MLEISLIEWPSDGNGPHFLGDLSDPDLVEQVQARLAAKYRKRLARLVGPAHLVPAPQASDETASDAATMRQEPAQATDGEHGRDS